MSEEFFRLPPDIPTDRPSGARIYDYALGGKDNFAVDREWAHRMSEHFPEGLDIARENRLFLYRAVRYLAQEAGIRQFLDLGSGLPTQDNVHQVAQRFQPDARVVYVDHDPIVLAHGRALLVEDGATTVITADVTEPDQIFDHPETREMIDFREPVAVLLFSVLHHVPEDEAAHRALRIPIQRMVSGSHLAITHVVSDEEETAADHTANTVALGLPWKTRLPRQVDAWTAELEAVDPGLVDIQGWRPDPGQPPLTTVVTDYLGASARSKRIYEYGGVLRKT